MLAPARGACAGIAGGAMTSSPWPVTTYSDTTATGKYYHAGPGQSVNRYFTSVQSAGKPSFQEIFLPSE